MAFYVVFAFIWVAVGEVSWDWYEVKLELVTVVYFLILVTLGVGNQILFHFEKKLIETYLDSLNRVKLRHLNLYMELVRTDYSYMCKDTFRHLSTI